MGAEECGEDSESEEDTVDDGDENQAKRLWSSEEDTELVKQVSKHGTRWATILAESTILAKRSRDAIRWRWRSQLMNAEVHDDDSESGTEEENE